MCVKYPSHLVFNQNHRISFSYTTHFVFAIINPNNWTFSTEQIYLSDMHDENVIRSKNGNIFVIDCDIRINTPEMNAGGIRELTNYVEFLN